MSGVNVASHIEAHSAAHTTAAAGNKVSQPADPSGPSFLDSLDSMMAASGTASQQPASGARKSSADASANNDASNANRTQAAPAVNDPSTSNVPAKTGLASSDSLKWTSKLSADPIVSTGAGSNLVKGKFNGGDEKSTPHKDAPLDPTATAPVIAGIPVMQPVQWTLDPQSLNGGTHTRPIAVDEQTGTVSTPSNNFPGGSIAGTPVQQNVQPELNADEAEDGVQNNTFAPTSHQDEAPAQAAPAVEQAPAAPVHTVRDAQETATASAENTSADAAAAILNANSLSAQAAVTDPGAAALASQALAASMSKDFKPAPNAVGAASAARAAGLAASNAAGNNAAAKAATKAPGKDIKDITDLKSDNSVTVESTSQASSSTKSSTSNGDRNQHDASTQQAAAVTAPVAVQHTVETTTHQQVAAFGHNTEVAAAAPRATADAVATVRDHAAEAAAASASSASNTTATTPSSSINTARLIQSVGQSEMRVGMRSAEFGDISIRTSATHDSLSAQISLDHADLAKALTAHLPEMQARLGGNGNVDVRVNDNAQSSTSHHGAGNQNMGGNAGSSTGSNDGSRGRSQYSGSNNFSQSRGYDMGQQFVPAAVATTGVSNGRLSIQA